jgi:ABC-type polar amino acid transport system ATPase subunit
MSRIFCPITSAGLPTYQGIRKGEAKMRSLEFLAKVDVQERANHRPNDMSGGLFFKFQDLPAAIYITV